MADTVDQLKAIINELQRPPRSIHDMTRRADLCRQSLSLLPRSQNEQLWAALQVELGNNLVQTPTGSQAENIEQAIAAYQEALSIMDRKTVPIDWAATMVNLAGAYANRIRGDRADNIEQAIAIYQDALNVITRMDMPIEWASTMMNLANTYRNRIRGDRAENLEQAIAAYHDALSVRTSTTMPAEWAITMMNLAGAYRIRILGNRAENVEQAISIYQEALSIMTHAEMPTEWATAMMNLANAYANRIRGDRADNIDRAIVAYYDTLAIITRTTVPNQWATTMMNLAASLRNRIRGDQEENIEQAITAYEEALTVMTCASMPIAWATAKMNLANAYYSRIHGDRAENIEHAILAYQEALTIFTRTDMPIDWAKTKVNLANAYRNRIHGDRADNIEQSIAACQDALTIQTRTAMPVEWASAMLNLANAYYCRICGDRTDNLKQAIAAYQSALQVRTLEFLPADHRDTQHNLADLLFGEKNWQAALTAYAGAVRAGQFLLDTAYTEFGRQAEVDRVAQLYSRSAYCLWQLKQPTATLQQLEHGKTRLLSQALALGDAYLSQLPPVQQRAIQTLRQTIRELEGGMRLPADTPSRPFDQDLADLLRQARADLSQEIAAIRAERPDFMPIGLDAPEFLALIPENGALVAPCLTGQGGFVVVIPHGVDEVTDEHIVPLSNLTTATVQTWLLGPPDDPDLGGWLDAYDQFRQNNVPYTQNNWFAAISRVCKALWETLMELIHHQLQTLNLTYGASVLLIPQGGLGLLPLHAAWREVDGQPRCFSDEYTVTYAPSGYALRVSQQRAAQSERQARSLFAVINPTGNLSYTPLEGETIANLFPSEAQTVLWEQAATTGAFFTTANGHAYLHYAGHGFYHWDDPLQSSLQLADKPFTLADILSGLDLSACRLVTLSACETGITDIRQSPDEYIGLPAGFLQAGAPAVISTLWAVNDLSTMLLMECFYQLHLEDGLELARALRQAQLWLRHVTAGELAKRFGEEAQQFMTRLSKEEALAYWYRFENMDKGERPFAHPYYWAAFTFTGA